MSKSKKEEKEDIIIDYNNIDVQNIMAQIKKKVASQRFKTNSLKDSPEKIIPPYIPSPEKAEENKGLKKKIKMFILRGIRPFSPLIKLMILPFHQELVETNQRLEETNQKLNRTMEYVKLIHNLSHNLVVELTKLKVEEENIKIKNRIMEKDFEFLSRKEKVLEKKVYP